MARETRHTTSDGGLESARDRIQSAAARLYAIRGFDGTSMRGIAEAAGVTKPLVFYHFESKEKLYASILQEAICSCSAAGNVVLDGPATATEKVRSLLRHHVTVMREKPEVFAFVYQILTMPGDLPLGFDYRSAGRELFGQLVRIIEEGRGSREFRDVDPVAAAVVPMASLGMYAGALLSGYIEEIPEGLEDRLMSILLDGIKERTE